MASVDTGRAAVTRAAIAESQAELARLREAEEAAQLDLLTPVVPADRLRAYRDKQGNVAERDGLSPEEHEAERQRVRRGGRPKGATNLATREWRDHLIRTVGMPQMWLGQWLRLTPEELGRRLGVSVAAAFEWQVEIAKELGVYTMSRMAPSDDRGNAVPFMALVMQGGDVVIGGDGKAAPEGARPPWAHLDLAAGPATPEAA